MMRMNGRGGEMKVVMRIRFHIRGKGKEVS